jgi:GWxTD domain-containing protein
VAGESVRIGPVPWTLAVLVLLLSATSAVAAKSVPLKKWVEGPIRYVITRHEARQFRDLKTDEDRSLFVERFWLRRDPTPGTLMNEYREMFWTRVRDANEMFLDSANPGWETDRGKIYILYGPPTEIHDYIDLETRSTSTSGRGLIRWIYEGKPGGRTDVDPVIVVPFVRDMSGEYRVSSDPKLASVFFDELALKEGRAQFIEDVLTALGAPGRGELGVMLDLGKLQEVPPYEQVLLERIETAETYRAYPLPIQVDRFRHPDEDGTLMIVTVHLPDVRPDTRPPVLARFTQRDPDGKQVLVGEGSFLYRPDGSGGTVAQSRIVLEPGTWDLFTAAAVLDQGKTGVANRVVVAPPPTPDLTTSDVVLASDFSPVAVDALRSHDQPFVLGAFEVVPRAGRPLQPGDTLFLFYEIYGGSPPYSVSYRLQGLDHDGSWVSLGRPAVIDPAQAAQGWELPLGVGWPTGDYRVVVEIGDAAGADTSVLVPFTLGPEDAIAVSPEPEAAEGSTP